MDKDKIILGVQDIVRDTLDDDNINLSRSTRASDVPGWDSMTHIRIILAVEKRFSVRFLGEEIEGIEDVGRLVDLVHGHLQIS